VDRDAIRLEPFGPRDFGSLLAEIPDARFLLQWAGPEYIFPLDAEQLRRTLARTAGDVPSLLAFRAMLAGTGETVGHVQLMGIDQSRSTCVLGRVLVFADHRGKGLGASLVRSALVEAFVGLALNSVALHVFAFNEPAVAVYERVGFVRSGPDLGPRLFENEAWPVLRMELARERFAHQA
jgi:RimJ/RimL family protein N-acetyltransferase